MSSIVHVVAYYPPPHSGGMEQVAYELATRQARAGHTVRVITTAVRGVPPGTTEPVPGLRVVRLPAREVAHTPIPQGLANELRSIPADSVIHLHIAQAWIPEVTARIARERKIPYICHIHLDVGRSGVLGYLLPLYKQLFLRRVLHGAAAVVCLAPSHAQTMQRKYGLPAERIHVIPNGVAEPFFTLGKARKHTPLRVVTVARLSVQKNIPRMVRAASMVQHPFELRIVGEGELESDIRALIAELHAPVTLLGRKDRTEILAEFRDADAFILTSDVEGLPMALLEAFAAGLPVIVSDIDGMHEAVDGVGLLVSPLTPEAFAQALDQVLGESRLRQTLARASAKAAKQYMWNAILKQFATVYERARGKA